MTDHTTYDPKGEVAWRAANDPLFMYVIYDRPKDYPGEFVVRRWGIEAGKAVPLAVVATAPTADQARESIPAGCAQLPVYDADDPVILEVWA